jgi:hypothetical protein
MFRKILSWILNALLGSASKKTNPQAEIVRNNNEATSPQEEQMANEETIPQEKEEPEDAHEIRLIQLNNKTEIDNMTRVRINKDFFGIVVHWTGAPKQDEIITMRYCLYTSLLGYHYFIGRDGTIYELAPWPARMYHCGTGEGHPLYTKEAQIKYGTIRCPPWEHTASRPHPDSPNSCLMGICTAVEDAKGTITPECRTSLVVILAHVCRTIGKQLDIHDDIVLHNFLTGKDCHKWYVDNPEDWKTLKDDIATLVKSEEKLPIVVDKRTLTITKKDVIWNA